ncbi:hypothetical protein RB593_001112 [Gaeumannomyces tritici]
MAGSTGDAQLFEGVFKVTHVDAVKYDRVARITATSDAASADPMDMTLDINTELFPMSEGDGFRVVLATSLALDGGKDEEKGWRDASKLGGPPTLADNFDYVCYGKVYRFEDSKNGEQISSPRSGSTTSISSSRAAKIRRALGTAPTRRLRPNAAPGPMSLRPADHWLRRMNNE